jgi:hypothetical protein
LLVAVEQDLEEVELVVLDYQMNTLNLDLL